MTPNINGGSTINPYPFLFLNTQLKSPAWGIVVHNLLNVDIEPWNDRFTVCSRQVLELWLIYRLLIIDYYRLFMTNEPMINPVIILMIIYGFIIGAHFSTGDSPKISSTSCGLNVNDQAQGPGLILGGFNQPRKIMYFVNGFRMTCQIWKIKHVPTHQPGIYIYVSSSIHERRNYANASRTTTTSFTSVHMWHMWIFELSSLLTKLTNSYKFKKHTTPEDIITIPWNQVSTAADLLIFFPPITGIWAAGTPAFQMVRKNIKWSLLMVRKKPHPILRYPKWGWLNQHKPNINPVKLSIHKIPTNHKNQPTPQPRA